MINSTSFKKGHIGYWKNKVSPRRNGKYIKCLVCKKDMYIALWQEKSGVKYCSIKCRSQAPISIEHRKNLSESHSGSKSITWRGGVTKKYVKRLQNYIWKGIIKNILIRDNNCCKQCGNKNRLSIHHIIPYRFSNGDENKCIFWNITINDPANLVTLCNKCHAKEDWKFRKNEERGGVCVLYRIVYGLLI